jgi:phosphoribosylformimino-5-aminoimidazole carboxamide ribonucleotide (ProFAR) isomerase
MLEFIQETLGMGKVTVYNTKVTYIINKKQDIAKLLEIFNKYPLKSTKYLNFLDFKKAFELYTNSNKITKDILKQIEEIKGGMNTLRTSYNLPTDKSFEITPY